MVHQAMMEASGTEIVDTCSRTLSGLNYLLDFLVSFPPMKRLDGGGGGGGVGERHHINRLEHFGIDWNKEIYRVFFLLEMFVCTNLTVISMQLSTCCLKRSNSR